MEMEYGVDISNLQGHPDTYRHLDWYKNARVVVVQAIEPPPGFAGHDFIDPETGKRGYTGVQLRAARDDGKLLGIYTWLWDAFSGQTLIADQNNRLACVPASVQLHMRPWLDVEDTTPDDLADRQDDVMVALATLDAWAAAHGLPEAGVYTGPWYIDGVAYLAGWFPQGRVAWIAIYNRTPFLTATRVGHQYYDHPVDLDVFAKSEFINQQAAVTVPEETEEMQHPVPQQYIDNGWTTWYDVAVNLQGIANAMGQQVEGLQTDLQSARNAKPDAQAVDVQVVQELQNRLAQIAQIAAAVPSA